SFKVRRPQLILNGTLALSDGVIVKVNLSRMTEAVVNNEIQPTYAGAGNGTTEVEGKKFMYDQTIDGPGKFNAQISLLEDFLAKIDKSTELKSYYPAGVSNVSFTVRNIVSSAPYYTFSGGKFTGAKDYHADNQKVKTYRNEEFSWDNLKRYVEEAAPIGGRE